MGTYSSLPLESPSDIVRSLTQTTPWTSDRPPPTADRYPAVCSLDITFWSPRFGTQPLAFSTSPTLWVNP